LETGWGELEDLQVPMLECQQCLHDYQKTLTNYSNVPILET
jgi:hypothetical protein